MRSAFHLPRQPRRVRRSRRQQRCHQVSLERLEPRQLLTADAIALEPGPDQRFVSEVLGPPEATTAVSIIDNDPATGGAFLAVWQSYGEDGDGFGVFAQVFDRDGMAIPGVRPSLFVPVATTCERTRSPDARASFSFRRIKTTAPSERT